MIILYITFASANYLELITAVLSRLVLMELLALRPLRYRLVHTACITRINPIFLSISMPLSLALVSCMNLGE